MKMNLSIEWWENEDTEGIEETHKEQLNLHGVERAAEMMEQGYVEGELHQEIEGVYYDGYWNSKA